MIHVFREKDFFYLFLVPSSWRVSQSPIRVVIIIIMDHSYNNNNKWRSDAICNDPRVWIKGGSTMDQHGSTWINRLQPAPSACRRRPDSCVMAHVSCVMAHVSCIESVQRPRFRRPTHVSCVPLTWHASHASGSWLMRPTLQAHGSCVPRFRLMAHASHASGVRLMRPDSWLMRRASTLQASGSCVLTHGSRVMRPASCVRRQASGVRRQASGVRLHAPHSAHSAAARCRS